MSARDTIAAIATPPGAGGVGIIRISGPAAFAIAEGLTGRRPVPRQAHYVRFRAADGEELDDGLLLGFAAPASYTGEDVVECQVHGAPFLLARLLREICAQGARQARPGEFSERAFLNGKLDLAQAEAVADLIGAGSEQAALAARRSLTGVFSQRCSALHERLVDLRMRLEAAIDFPEEDIDFLSDPELRRRWQSLHVEHQELTREAARGVRLSQGITVVLAGAPNSGKSSLLNTLARRDTAIVTPVAGTTRDLLRETLTLAGVPVTVIDTAGLRETEEVVEAEGVRRARAAMADADFLLHLRAPDAPDTPLPETRAEVIEVHNKCDLANEPAGWLDAAQRRIWLSAKYGQGVEALIQRLAGDETGREGEFSARQRHVEALARCGTQLAAAGEHLEKGDGDLAAEALRLAQQALGEITGQVHSDELLGRIFSSFCIGK